MAIERWKANMNPSGMIDRFSSTSLSAPLSLSISSHSLYSLSRASVYRAVWRRVGLWLRGHIKLCRSTVQVFNSLLSISKLLHLWLLSACQSCSSLLRKPQDLHLDLMMNLGSYLTLFRSQSQDSRAYIQVSVSVLLLFLANLFKLIRFPARISLLSLSLSRL